MQTYTVKVSQKVSFYEKVEAENEEEALKRAEYLADHGEISPENRVTENGPVEVEISKE